MKIPEITNCDYEHVILNENDPQIVLIKNFISNEEKENILEYIDTLEPLRATTVLNGESVVSDSRIATTYSNWNGKWATETLMNIDKRIMKLTNWKTHLSENWAFIRYGIGEKYSPHFDYLDEDIPKVKIRQHGIRKQRNGTFLLYLKDAEEGGLTCFPRLKLNIKAEPCDGIFFNYIPGGTINSFHGGTTVRKGEKIIANRWLNTMSNDDLVLLQ